MVAAPPPRAFQRSNPRAARRFASILRACEGVVAIETAILLPVFLFMLIGTVEAGRLLWTQSSLQAAVETAARCLAVNSCDAQTTVDNQMAAYGLAAQPTVTPSTPSCGYQVYATLSFTFVAQNLFPASVRNLTLGASSCYPSQS